MTSIIRIYNKFEFLLQIIGILCFTSSFTMIIASLDDFQQQIYWKIIYIHVPLASFSLLIYVIKVICSISYIVTQISQFSMFAKNWSTIAFTLQILCIITGSLWGKAAWGSYWVFDSRLTSMLVITIITGIYVIMNATLDSNTKNKDRILAIISIIGSINIPIIKYSVDWWASLHQKSTINIWNTGATKMDETIYIPLIGIVIMLAIWTIQMIALSSQKEQMERKEQIIYRK